ncbi:GroES-like protein [Lentinus tigrinus ALCF2SS1-7]|uniref:GroES-like protein n=1 Tax=Lentinus tigrinus ALCF2SS1-6 TaxID=1328759 RepID=A0A5C2RQQ0_9APHY|nr:GroES-like protein [Lentinus tigrinus ALCF2SS1-6]RPD76806.1 GroES-like protein [Lentinus tigrinus ALCF2SS1-7]
MPSQQKALFLDSRQGSLTVRETDKPTPGPGELLVKVEAAALNPIDWMIQAFGVFVEKYPAIIGSDGAGTVVAVGEGVTAYAVSDRVAFQGTIDPVQKTIKGTFAQYTTTPAKFAMKIPANVSPESAATMPCTLPTAATVLYNQDESSPSVKLTAPWSESGKGKYAGKRALVLGGSSSVGQYVIQFARLSGFSPIIATASPQHSDFLKSLGATHVVDRNLPSETLQEEVTRIGGGPFDLVYDAISTADTQAVGYALTGPNGDFVVVSPAVALGGDDGPQKRVHMARGLLTLPGNDVVGAGLLAALPTLLESGDIKPNRTEVLSGGLNGIVPGLERLKSKQVSGTKLVVLPQETV